MTTVIPGGSPSVVFNRDGVRITSLTATVSSLPPAAIVRHSATTVALVSAINTDDHVILPADAELGDTVEVYFSGSFASVVPDSGSQINGNGTDIAVHVLSAIFRKVSATQWYGPSVA